jgi:hypothetical protein
MLASLLTWLYCRLWLWPALARLDRPARRPTPTIRRWRRAAVLHVAGRLVGVEVRLVLAPVAT